MKARRGANLRGYPDRMISAESSRPMKRGFKRLTITVDGRAFDYNQPGWWCDLTDPNDREGALIFRQAPTTSDALSEASSPRPH